MQGRQRWHGGPTHNEALLRPVEEECHRLGARTTREARVGLGRHAMRVDLLVEPKDGRLVVEGELGAKRVINAVLKARILEADALLVVLPNRRVVQAAQRRLDRLSTSESRGCRIFLLTVGEAVHRLSSIFDFMTSAVSHVSSSQQSPQETSRPSQHETGLPFLLQVDELASLLRTTRKAVYALTKRGRLPGACRVGRRLLFRRDDVLRWLGESPTPSPKEQR